MSFFSQLFRRALHTPANNSVSFTQNLTLWPNFFGRQEQRILLTAALHKLDLSESRQSRRRRKGYLAEIRSRESVSASAHDLFLPDKYYDFLEGHYDGVIHHFREMHLTSWPEAEFTELTPTLKRLYSLCPTQDTQTHLLHLASYGEILPHVDNISASGSWILGVSLGSERVLRMEGPTETEDVFDVSLPSGSVYLQRDSMRFQYKHSILQRGSSEGRSSPLGQRLSIMIRDRLPPDPFINLNS